MTRKVLFTASTYSHIYNFHLSYLRAFAERGWQVYVACKNAPESIPFVERSVSLPFQKKIWRLSNFSSMRELRKLIRREKFDLICAHTTLASFFTRLALVGVAERPVLIVTVHGYLFDDRTNWPVRKALLFAEALLANKTDRLLVMNEYDNQVAQKYRLAEKITLIPGMGVDYARLNPYIVSGNAAEKKRLRKKHGISDDSIVLSCVGEFSHRKCQEFLIRALRRFPANTILVLAGDGLLREHCSALSKRIGLNHRVLFLGQFERIGELYGMSDIHISASRSEGLPFNIIEAMYMGLPVVATDVKGHSDLIRRGETGFLYRYGDVRECAKYVTELVESEELRREMGRNAHSASLPYGIEFVMPDVMNAYLSAFQADEGDGDITGKLVEYS